MRVDPIRRVGRERGRVLGITTAVVALIAVLPGAVAAQSPSPEAVVPVDPAIVAEIAQHAGPDPSVHYVGVTSDPSIYMSRSSTVEPAGSTSTSATVRM